MLALDAPLGLVGELFVWGDHADPNRFYYAPGAPSLARAPDGEPEFSCILWQAVEAGERATAGALLGFTAELAVSPEAIEATMAELRKRGGDPVLTAVPLVKAHATLASALNAGSEPTEGEGHEPPPLIEHVLAEADADLVPTNRALFALSTEDPVLARLIEGLVRDAAPSPIGVRYTLSFVGLRPAMHARIHADYQRAFKELSVDFKAGLAYQGVGVKIGIEHATRRLQESGALEIEVTHFTDDAALRSQLDAAIRWFQEDLQQRFFQSALRPPPGNPDIGRVLASLASLGGNATSALNNNSMLGKVAEKAGLSPEKARAALGGLQGAPGGADKQLPIQFQLGFSLRDIDEQEQRTETIVLDEARAERRELAPQGLLIFGSIPGRIRNLDLGTAFPELRVAIRPLGDFAADGVERLVVELAWPDSDTPTRHESFLFESGDAPPAAFVAWTQGQSRSYRYRMEVHFRPDGPWPGRDLAWASDWRTSDRLDLAVHPLAAVPRREIEVSLAPEALEGVTSIELRLDIDDVASTVLLDAENRRAVVRRRLDGPGVARATPSWRLPDGTVFTGEPVLVDDPVLVVGGPWRSKRRLRVVPMLPVDVLDVVVTITPDEAGVPARVISLAGGAARAEPVDLPSMQEEPPPYTVDVLIVRGDGTTFSTRVEGSVEPVVLVSDREGAHRRVQARLLAPASLGAVGVIAVLVQLLDDADQEVDRVLWTEGARADGVLLVPATTPFRYRVRVTRYAPDGTAIHPVVTESDAPTLLIPAAPPPVPG